MKKTVAFLCALAIVLSFSGCKQENILSIGSVNRDTNNSLSMTYHSLSGYRQTDITVAEGKSCSVICDITTDSGDAGIVITDITNAETPTVVLSKQNLKTESFTTELSSGKYSIRINAESHRGSHNIVWVIK